MRVWIWLLLAISFLFSIPRVLALSYEDKKEILLVHPLAEFRVSFTNSVTKRPVEIRFKPLFYFQGFEMLSDPDTISYYTFGTYELNRRLSGEKRVSLSFCSEEGIELRVLWKKKLIKGGCAKLEILWPRVGSK